MEIDPMELTKDEKDEAKGKAKSILNAMVAVTIALLATFLGVCRIKDDNIYHAMQQAKLTRWTTEHSKGIEAKVYDTAATQLDLTGSPKAAAIIADYRKQSKKELSDRDDWQEKAELADRDCDELNYRHDQSICPTLRSQSPFRCSPLPL